MLVRISDMSCNQIAIELDLELSVIQEHYNNFFKIGKSLHPFCRNEELHNYAMRVVRTMFAPKLIDARRTTITSRRQELDQL